MLAGYPTGVAQAFSVLEALQFLRPEDRQLELQPWWWLGRRAHWEGMAVVVGQSPKFGI